MALKYHDKLNETSCMIKHTEIQVVERIEALTAKGVSFHICFVLSQEKTDEAKRWPFCEFMTLAPRTSPPRMLI